MTKEEFQALWAPVPSEDASLPAIDEARMAETFGIPVRMLRMNRAHRWVLGLVARLRRIGRDGALDPA